MSDEISASRMTAVSLQSFSCLMSYVIAWIVKDRLTDVCSVTWPLNGSEAAVDLALLQTSLRLSCKCT